MADRKTTGAIPADAPGADLFGRPPARCVQCPGCGERAEPYVGRFCWLCAHTRQMARVLAGSTVTRADARQMLAGPAGEVTPWR